MALLNVKCVSVASISDLSQGLGVIDPGMRTLRFRSILRLLVTANIPSSLILVTLMMEALNCSETSVLIRTTRRNVPEDSNLHSHRRENLKAYNQKSVVRRTNPRRAHNFINRLLLHMEAGVVYCSIAARRVGQAVARALGLRLPTVAARIRDRSKSSVICSGRSDTGTGFSEYYGFTCHSLIHSFIPIIYPL
jgi:hypothetical protein